MQENTKSKIKQFWITEEKKKVQYIVWDWNGTLLDDSAACVETINSMLHARGLPNTDLESYRRNFRFPVHHFYTALGFVLENENWAKLADEYHAAYRAVVKGACLRDGTQELLREMCSRGIRHAILSACEQQLLAAMLEKYTLTAMFDPVIGADNMDGASKDKLAEIMRKKLQLPAQNVLMIGDTDHDAEIAKQMGWHCLLLAGGHQSLERLFATEVPVMHNWQELKTELMNEYGD